MRHLSIFKGTIARDCNCNHCSKAKKLLYGEIIMDRWYKKNDEELK